MQFPFTIEQAAAWLSVLVAFFSAIWWLTAKFNRMIVSLKTLERRVTTLWSFHLSRGRIEAVSKGLAMRADTFLLPGGRLLLTPQTRVLFQPIVNELRSWYTENGSHMTMDELTESIETNFREWLITNICEPLGVHEGACIALALEVARETAV